MDHASICQLIKDHFDVKITRAHGAADVLSALHSDSFDLVLINRKLDRDQSDGLEIIRDIKADNQLADVPVMLITNFAEHQQMAVSAGALPGFGKAALFTEETQQRLSGVLGSRSLPSQKIHGGKDASSDCSSDQQS